jgi:hypothetical protein
MKVHIIILAILAVDEFQFLNGRQLKEKIKM